MPGVWRLLLDDAPEGAWNMAVDRAIQLEHAGSNAPPTLRLYRWRRPTVTLGKFQDPSGVDFDVTDREGLDVVRRFTGGRGVLHDDELTYAIVAGERDGIPRGVSASYRVLCAALAEAYRLLGVEAALTSRPRGEPDSAACYLHATRADLSLGAAKLSGSAQVWHAGTCLQHGSFVRSRDVALEAAVFRLDAAAQAALAEKTATLSDVLGAPPSSDEIAEAVAKGVSSAFDVRMRPGTLLPSEEARAAGLLDEVQVRRPD